MTLCFAAKEKKQKSKWHHHAIAPSIIFTFSRLFSAFSHAIGKEEGKGSWWREGAVHWRCCSSHLLSKTIASGAVERWAFGWNFNPKIYIFFPPSLHRRNRVDRRKVLPALVAVANAREKLPGGFDRRSFFGGVVNQWTSSLQKLQNPPHPASQAFSFCISIVRVIIFWSCLWCDAQHQMFVHSVACVYFV